MAQLHLHGGVRTMVCDRPVLKSSRANLLLARLALVLPSIQYRAPSSCQVHAGAEYMPLPGMA